MRDDVHGFGWGEDVDVHPQVPVHFDIGADGHAVVFGKQQEPARPLKPASPPTASAKF